MSRFRFFFFLLLSIAFLTASCSGGSGDPAGSKRGTVKDVKGTGKKQTPKRPGGFGNMGLTSAAMPVEVRTIERRDMKDYLLASTTLEALREVEVYAKTSGVATSILVEEGDRVHKGDTLLIIDDREARLNLRKAEIAYREAKNALDRSKQMKARNLVSEEEFETVQLACERAKTELDEAKLAYQYTRVTAPIDGYIVDRLVELGTMVTQGKSLFRMAQFNPLRARIHIPEKDLKKVRIGQKVLLHAESEPSREFEGRVELISPAVDPASGTFKVTVRVDSPRGLLRPGMFVSCKIVVDRHEGALAVPKEAILYEGDRRYIYTVRDDTAERKDVDVGFTDDEYVEVAGDVSPGDFVVVAGQNNLASGMKVDIVRLDGKDAKADEKPRAGNEKNSDSARPHIDKTPREGKNPHMKQRVNPREHN